MPSRCLTCAAMASRAHRLAGFGLAELQHMAAGRMRAIVMIEGDDAVHLGPRDVQRFGDHRQRFLRHIAELFLDAVQDRQKRAFQPLQILDDRTGALSDPGTCLLHGHAAPSLERISGMTETQQFQGINSAVPSIDRNSLSKRAKLGRDQPRFMQHARKPAACAARDARRPARPDGWHPARRSGSRGSARRTRKSRPD